MAIGGATGGLVVHEPEAVIVRRVYEQTLAGRSQRQLARDCLCVDLDLGAGQLIRPVAARPRDRTPYR